MHLTVLPGTYSVCRLEHLPASLPPSPAGTEPGLYSVSVTDQEISLVCRADAEPTGARVEGPWRCLRVAGPLDFALTGILAALTAPLAEAEVPVFAVSTFDTDYLLVKSDDLPRACAALQAAGHRIQP